MPTATVVERRRTHEPAPPVASVPVPRRRRPSHQAFLVLYAAFIFIPLIAGVDKFFDLLVNWERYLSPSIIGLTSLTPHQLMMVVGAVEILAAVLVGVMPHIGGWVVAVWLWGIVANLLLVPGFFDIALRDIGLSLAAIALAKLSRD